MADTPSALTDEQRNALHVLGYLHVRMGQYRRVKKLAQALLALDAGDTRARRYLAVACLESGEAERALEELDRILAGGNLPSRHAVLHLLRARALWQMGRSGEARNALNAYLAAGGGQP